MKTWVRKTLSVGVLAAGALLFAPGAAHADSHQVNGGNVGFLNGTQLVTGVQVPVNVVGNSAGILGEAGATGVGVNRVESTHVNQVNGHNTGIANGSQVYLPISVPLNIVGNSAAVLGQASAIGAGVNQVNSGRTESGHTTEGWRHDRDGNDGNDVTQLNGGNTGIANGTQIYAPISVPINACGNSIALLGGAWSQGICGNDVFSNRGRRESGNTTGNVWQANGGNSGILNGSQLYAPISLPVNLSGNSIAALGTANSRAVSGNRIESAQDGPGNRVTQVNGGNRGLLNGTQIAAPISIPINACGNSLSLLGSASSVAACRNDVFSGDDFGGDGHGFGGDGFWIDDHGHRHHGGHGDLGGDNGVKGGHKGGHGGVKGDGGVKGTKPGYMGDNGDKPATNPAGTGYGATQPATNPAGYGGTKPATNPAGYGATKPATKPATAPSGYDSRDKSDTEATPVSNLTDTVGGMGDSSGLGSLGLLNTLR